MRAVALAVGTWSFTTTNAQVTLQEVNVVPYGSTPNGAVAIGRDPAQEVTCTLIALDIDKNVVGEIELQVPGAKEGSILVNAKIPTRLRAVNASVDSCRLP